jgi:hypothetical protein
MIRPGGLLLVVPHLFALPVSVLWVELQKEGYITKLRCEIYILQGHKLSTIENALTSMSPQFMPLPLAYAQNGDQ